MRPVQRVGVCGFRTQLAQAWLSCAAQARWCVASSLSGVLPALAPLPSLEGSPLRRSVPCDKVGPPPASFLVGSLSARSSVAGVCGPGEGARGFFPLRGLASPSLLRLPRRGPHPGGRCLAMVGPLLGLLSWCRAGRSRAQACLGVRAAGWSRVRAVPTRGSRASARGLHPGQLTPAHGALRTVLTSAVLWWWRAGGPCARGLRLCAARACGPSRLRNLSSSPRPCP